MPSAGDDGRTEGDGRHQAGHVTLVEQADPRLVEPAVQPPAHDQPRTAAVLALKAERDRHRRSRAAE